MNTIRILVADGHPVVRAGLRAIARTSPDIDVIGEAADGPSAVRLTTELDPDIVVAEAALPGLAGTEFIAQVCDGRPDRKVLVLTACETCGTLRELLAAGAVGCTLKRAPADELVRAIRAVACGTIYLDPTAQVALESLPEPAEELSDREQKVVRQIALGYSNKEIAAQLKLSVKTIETYKARAMDKLQTGSRVDLIQYAAKRGWQALKLRTPRP